MGRGGMHNFVAHRALGVARPKRRTAHTHTPHAVNGDNLPRW